MFINSKCVFAGSFDPVTYGHMHVIGMSAMTFSEVIVAIGVNENKHYLFDLQERLDMLKKACAKYSSVKVCSYSGMTADFLKEVGAEYLVRGVRNSADEAYERKVFENVSKGNPNLQFIVFNCPKELKNISSTAVREAILKGKPYEKFVPYEVIESIKEYSKLKNK